MDPRKIYGHIARLEPIVQCGAAILGLVMGSAASAEEESHSHGLLEYPHYTRPAVWRGLSVPDILLSGDHGAIAKWRQEQAETITRARRPDLWAAYQGRASLTSHH